MGGRHVGRPFLEFVDHSAAIVIHGRTTRGGRAERGLRIEIMRVAVMWGRADPDNLHR
jgi:hypothetical protein